MQSRLEIRECTTGLRLSQFKCCVMDELIAQLMRRPHLFDVRIGILRCFQSFAECFTGNKDLRTPSSSLSASITASLAPIIPIPELFSISSHVDLMRSADIPCKSGRRILASIRWMIIPTIANVTNPRMSHTGQSVPVATGAEAAGRVPASKMIWNMFRSWLARAHAPHQELPRLP